MERDCGREEVTSVWGGFVGAAYREDARPVLALLLVMESEEKEPVRLAEATFVLLTEAKSWSSCSRLSAQSFI